MNINYLQKSLLIIVIGFSLLNSKLLFSSGHDHKKQQKIETSSNRGVIAMDVVSNGKFIDLLLAEENNNKITLTHLRSLDKGNSFKIKNNIFIKNMDVFRPKRGFDPKIVANEDDLVVLWTKSGTSKWGDGPLQGARSRNGGKTWTEIKNPADDFSTDGHGFIGLTIDKNKKLHAVWLDTRNGTRGLRYTNSNDFGKNWAENKTIKAKTCECCWNSLYVFPDGSLNALYRSKDPRDMSLSSSSDEGNTRNIKSVVGDFKWEFNGCPHNGGSLAFENKEWTQELFSVVWTGKQDIEGIHFLSSNNLGKTWSGTISLGNKTAQHPDIAIYNNNIVVAWDGKDDNGKKGIIVSISSDKGKNWSKGKLISLEAEEQASHPRVIENNGNILVFWTSKINNKFILSKKNITLKQ